MRVFTTTHLQGVYPVGTAAIVIAANKQQAVEMLQNAVDHSAMPLQKVTEGMLDEITTDRPQVKILLDGDY